MVRELNGALYSKGVDKKQWKTGCRFFVYCLEERNRGRLVCVDCFSFNIEARFAVILFFLDRMVAICAMWFLDFRPKKYYIKINKESLHGRSFHLSIKKLVYILCFIQNKQNG